MGVDVLLLVALAAVFIVLVAVAYLAGCAAGYERAWNRRARDRADGKPTDPTWVSR